MMESEQKNYGLYGLLLGIAGLLIILLFVTIRSKADDSLPEVDITNQLPTISAGPTVNGGNQISPAEYASTQVEILGTYTDNNGCDEVSDGGKVSVYLGRSGVVSNNACNADSNNCYTNSSITMTNGTGSGADFACTVTGCNGGTDVDGVLSCLVDLAYYAEPTDTGTYSGENWNGAIKVQDGEGYSSWSDNAAELASLAALNLTEAAIDYGSLALGATSSADVALTVKNTGNKILDISYYGTDMTCTDGTIAYSKQKFDTVAETAYASMTYTLDDDSQDLSSFNLAKATSGQADSTDELYWRINIPSTGLSGACTGTNTIVAVDGGN